MRKTFREGQRGRTMVQPIQGATAPERRSDATSSRRRSWAVVLAVVVAMVGVAGFLAGRSDRADRDELRRARADVASATKGELALQAQVRDLQARASTSARFCPGA